MYASVMNGASLISGKGAETPVPPAELAALVHPEYRNRFAQWTRIRDCIEGEDVIKSRKTAYLPKRAKQEDPSYEADLKRAVFFNATGRTRSALLSSIFRRPGVVRLPDGISAESVTRDGMSVRKVARWLAEEVISVSRAGGFVDLPAEESHTPQPFLCLYPTECILSWAVERGVLKMVLLAERVADTEKISNMFNVQDKWQCRMLALDEEGYYYQLVGTPETFSSMTKPPVEGRHYPMVYGKKLTSIPFQFFGALKNNEEIEKPLLLDIADLNIKHFQASSNLERARAFVGSPVYAVFSDSSSGDSSDEALIVSPEIVWEFGASDKAEILEFKGTAMASLENGLEEKEEQMRVLGARLVSQRKNAAARSAESDSAATNSDDATLLDVVQSVSEGLTNLVKIMAEWKRARGDVQIILNKHFTAPNVGARELRAIDACLNRSLRPKDIFQLLQEAGLISDDEEETEYVAYIEKLKEEQEAATRAKLAQSVTPPNKPEPKSSTGPAPGSTNS